MATTFVRFEGKLVLPYDPSPQATSEPSDLSATLKPPPAAMAVTLLNPAGTLPDVGLILNQDALSDAVQVNVPDPLLLIVTV